MPVFLHKELSQNIIGAAIEVHSEFGPGLLESAYRRCLCRELSLRGLFVQEEEPLPITYKGFQLDCGYRMDLVVDRKIIVEVKAVQDVHPVHEAQLISYLKLSGLRVGLLINFHVLKLIDGVKRLAV